MNKLLNWTYRVLGIIPLLWSLSVVLFYFYIVSKIGYEPSYNNPPYLDNDFASTWGRYLIIFFIISSYCIIAFIGLFIINLFFKILKKSNINYINILISSIGIILAIIIMNFIPCFSRALDWIFD
jgi:hypothetical protein